MRIHQFASVQVQAQINKTFLPKSQAELALTNTNNSAHGLGCNGVIPPSYNCAPPAGLDKLLGKVGPANVGPQAMIDQLAQQANKIAKDLTDLLQGAGNSCEQQGPNFDQWFDDIMGQATQPSGRCEDPFGQGIPQPPHSHRQPCDLLHRHMKGQSADVWQKTLNVLQSVLDLLRSLLGQSQNTRGGMQNEINNRIRWCQPPRCAPKTESKPETEAAPKPESKPETEAAPKPESKPETEAAPQTNDCDGVKPAAKKMDFKGACEILDKHFGVLDQAAGIGPRDGIISRLDLHAITNNPGAPKELKQAARFFLNNPAYFGKADGATALFGIRDGLISRADLRKQL